MHLRLGKKDFGATVEQCMFWTEAETAFGVRYSLA